ncbi:MAG: AEC family transporter [Pseudoxanthomonas sp.]
MAFDAFALILAMLALGMLLARLRALPVETPDVLNRVVLYLCLPAAVLLYVPRLRLDRSLLAIAATPWLLMLAAVAMVWLVARALRLARPVQAVLLVCVALSNSSFVGYPMIRALLGEQALPYAVVYDQFGTFVLLSSYGLAVLARYSGEHPPGWREIVARMGRFPPLWALLFALLAMPTDPPGWIGAALQRLADCMLPLVMLAVGFSLRLRLPREELAPLAVGLALRLLVLPALALGLSRLLGLHGAMLQANVLESAMPVMITAGALAISHNLAPRLAAALVGYSLLLSLATLPAWAWLLQRLG